MGFFFPAERTVIKKILKVICCLTYTAENYCHKKPHANTAKFIYASQTEHFIMNPSGPTCSRLLKSLHTYALGSSMQSHSPFPTFPHHFHLFLSAKEGTFPMLFSPRLVSGLSHILSWMESKNYSSMMNKNAIIFFLLLTWTFIGVRLEDFFIFHRV